MGTEALDSTAPPRVSMVMPVHNGARWLADAIASASQRAPLCTGMTIDTRGGAVESRASVPIGRFSYPRRTMLPPGFTKVANDFGAAHTNFALQYMRSE